MKYFGLSIKAGLNFLQSGEQGFNLCHDSLLFCDRWDRQVYRIEYLSRKVLNSNTFTNLIDNPRALVIPKDI